MSHRKRRFMLTLILIGCLLISMFNTAAASQSDENVDTVENMDTVTPSTLSTTDDDWIIVEAAPSVLAAQEAELYTPDNILDSPTNVLLEYFLTSDYMLHQCYREGLMSSPGLLPFEDYTNHSAYRELLTRDDFPAELEAYVKYHLTEAEFTDEQLMIMEKLFEQPTMKTIFSANNSTLLYPNLYSFYTLTANKE